MGRTRDTSKIITTPPNIYATDDEVILKSLVDAKGDLLVGTANDAIDRLGVTGTTGAVLTADAGETTGLKWADAGSVGGLVHIETQTFSAVSAVSFSNDVFTSDFDNYRVMIEVTDSTNAANLRIRFRASGSDIATSTYTFASVRNRASGASIVSQLGDPDTFFAVTGFPGSAGRRTTASVDIFQPKSTDLKHFNSTGVGDSSGLFFQRGAGYNDSATSCDSLTFLAQTGTITGKMALYGYKV